MFKTIRSLFLLITVVASLFMYPLQSVYALAIPAEINKQFNPILIDAGGTSVLRVTIFNPNTFPLTNAAWTDNLIGVQTGLKIANPNGLNVTCVGGSVIAVPDTTTLSLSGGIVPAQIGAVPGECFVEINVTSTTAGNLINTIPANNLKASGNDGGTPVVISNTTPASATLTVVAVVPPTLSKGFSPNTISMGNVSTLAITINNNDTNTNLTGTSFTDTLPANVILATPAVGVTPLTNCGVSALLAATAGGNTIALTNATVTPGLNCVVTVNVTSATQGVYINTIPAGPGNPGSIVTQQGVTNASPASATLNVQPINIAKQFNPTSFQAGGTSTLTITLQNLTASDYTGLNLTDTLPVLPNSNLTYVAASSATTCAPGTPSNTSTTVTLTGGTIPANSSCTITVEVTTTASAPDATYRNTIPPGAVFIGSNPTLTNGIPAIADVSVYAIGTGMAGSVKSFSIDPIDAGQNTRLRIDLFAPADTNLTNFSMTDNLPLGVTITNINSLGVVTPPAISGCGAIPPRVLTANTGAAIISLSGGTILAGARCRIDVWVTSSTPGTVTNTISPAAISNNENRHPSGNLTDTLTVNSAENLSVTKDFNPPTVNPGGLSILTITLRNTYPSPLVSTSLTDNLPGTVANGVVVAPIPNASTTCTGGIITAVPASKTITMTGGTVPSQAGGVPGICTITVTVQGNDSNATPSNRDNTIPTANVSGTVQSTGATIAPIADAVARLRTEILTIGVVKGFNPVLVFGGAFSTMSVQLVNPNNIDLTGVTFTDDMTLLGTGMELANPVTFNIGTCGGVLTGNPGDSSFSFTGGTLLANSNCTLTLRVVMAVNGNLTNRIPAGAVTTFNGVSSTQPTEASLTNLPGASVSKSFNPNTILTGGFSTLTITIKNTSNIPLVGMALTDNLPGTLPIGLEVAGGSAPAPVNNCGGTFSAPIGSQTIALTGGTLAGSASCTITVSVTSSIPGTYVNIIPAGGLTATAGGSPVSNTTPTSDTLVVNPGGYSLGNRVWFDTDNSGTINGAEVGVSNVRVELYQDNGNGIYDAGDTFQSFVATDASGYYRFDNLAAGDYVVLIPADNFRNVGAGDNVAGDPLSGYWSSGTNLANNGTVSDSIGPDADVTPADSDDNGVTTFTGNTLNYVSAQAVTLGPGSSEPVGETDKSGTSGEAPDAFSNLTVDFGFYRQELGNLVFIDANNNGKFDAGDSLLSGATVRLFAGNGTTEIEVGPDGILGTSDDATGGVITGAAGTYLFSGLPQGDYIVKVTPPVGYISAVDTANIGDTTTPNNNIDNNDNGVGTATGIVTSNLVTLTPGGLGAASNNVVSNSSGTTSNPTMDFGFIASSGFSKTIVDTNQSFTSGNDVAIGEIVTYQVSINLPVGVSLENVTITDRMDKGLAYVNCLSVNVGGADLTSTICPSAVVSSITDPADLVSNPANPGRQVIFNLGNIAALNEVPQIVIQYRAVVLDVIENQRDIKLKNNAVWAWTGGSFTTSAPDVTIVEPNLTIAKTANVNFIANGSAATFTLEISHTPSSNADAFDVVISDVLPPGLDYVANSINCDAGEQDPDVGSCVYDAGTRTIKAQWSVFTQLPANARGIIRFGVVGNESIPANGNLTNIANVEWTSLPGNKIITQSFFNKFGTERFYDPTDLINFYNASASLSLTPLGDGGNGGGRAVKINNVSVFRPGGFLIPVTGFAPNTVTTLDSRLRPAYNSTSLIIEIPVIKMKTSIVGVQLKNRNWDISWLQDQVGWLIGTAYPSWEGNSVLTAHSVNSNGKPGIFSNLRSLNTGEYIFVNNLGYRYTYKIISNKYVQPDDITVLKHEEEAHLTLITCDAFDEKTGTYLRRVVVRAVLVDVQEIK